MLKSSAIVGGSANLQSATTLHSAPAGFLKPVTMPGNSLDELFLKVYVMDGWEMRQDLMKAERRSFQLKKRGGISGSNLKQFSELRPNFQIHRFI
jgi:hypothetical protein